MRKLFVLFSAVFLFCALTGVNAWAANLDTSVLDRHAVWTKIIEDHEKKIEKSKTEASESSEKQNAQASREDHVKMDVQIKDVPWQRVG